MTSLLIDSFAFGFGLALVGDCLFPPPASLGRVVGWFRFAFIFLGAVLIRLSF